MKRAKIAALCLIGLLVLVPAWGRQKRRANPVNTAAAQTQSVNETERDTSRINAQMRKRPIHYVNNDGFNVYVDSVTGDEWIDSTVITSIPKMEYPLWDALTVGVNVWDPIMRIFGQHYGIADAWVELSMHNRYKPIFEVGLGTARYKPSDMNYTYRSPLSVYFRIGANYNFLFNSNPDYSFFGGLRYGLSPFSYSIDDVTIGPGYWDETTSFNIPAQHITVGWFEFVLGLRVKIWGPISAGWTFRYKSILHSGKAPYGKPWYVPGFGAPGAISGSFSVSYTLPLRRLNKSAADAVINADTIPDLTRGSAAAPAEGNTVPSDSITVTE